MTGSLLFYSVLPVGTINVNSNVAWIFFVYDLFFSLTAVTNLQNVYCMERASRSWLWHWGAVNNMQGHHHKADPCMKAVSVCSLPDSNGRYNHLASGTSWCALHGIGCRTGLRFEMHYSRSYYFSKKQTNHEQIIVFRDSAHHHGQIWCYKMIFHDKGVSEGATFNAGAYSFPET